jgi:hypothetical protein
VKGFAGGLTKDEFIISNQKLELCPTEEINSENESLFFKDAIGLDD